MASHELALQPRTYSRDAEALKWVFRQVDATSCPGSFNFHLHTNCSDGRLTPETLMEQAFALGLTAFAITDHHSVDGYYRARQWLEDWRWRNPRPLSGSSHSGRFPRLFSGVEITCRLEGVDVHILGYGFYPANEAMQPYLKKAAPTDPLRDARLVIQAIQQAGGLAVLAHPARYRRGAAELVAAAKALQIDGMETYYAYDNPGQWRSCPKQTPLMQSLAAQHQLLSTCGTDTHGLVITRRL